MYICSFTFPHDACNCAVLGRPGLLSVLWGVSVHTGGGGGVDEEFEEVSEAQGAAGKAVPVGGEGGGQGLRACLGREGDSLSIHMYTHVWV